MSALVAFGVVGGVACVADMIPMIVRRKRMVWNSCADDVQVKVAKLVSRIVVYVCVRSPVVPCVPAVWLDVAAVLTSQASWHRYTFTMMVGGFWSTISDNDECWTTGGWWLAVLRIGFLGAVVALVGTVAVQVLQLRRGILSWRLWFMRSKLRLQYLVRLFVQV